MIGNDVLRWALTALLQGWGSQPLVLALGFGLSGAVWDRLLFRLLRTTGRQRRPPGLIGALRGLEK